MKVSPIFKILRDIEFEVVWTIDFVKSFSLHFLFYIKIANFIFIARKHWTITSDLTSHRYVFLLLPHPVQSGHRISIVYQVDIALMSFKLPSHNNVI